MHNKRDSALLVRPNSSQHKIILSYPLGKLDEEMNLSGHITLAVMPFEDLTLQKDLTIYCRSFSSDLVTELSKFKQFFVLATPQRLSVTTAVDYSKFIEESKPDYHIMGSFRCDNESVRVNVQLYDCHSQHLVWANRLEGPLSGLSKMQEHLLTEVVGVLQQQINYDLLSKIRKKDKVDFKAYEYWLYGMEELKKASVETDLKAREFFEKALQIQPDYSLAYSGISLTYFNEWSCQLWDRWDVCKSGAYEWAQKAIELDDQDYIAALVLGKVFLYEGAYETAEIYLRKSLLLNSNDPAALIQIATYFIYLQAYDEAVNLYERALKLNPHGAEDYYPYGSFIYFERGEFEKAAALIVQTQKAKWADIEAFHAATYYFLNDKDKMLAHWNNFLNNYRKLIARGNDFSETEAIEWVLKINPFRKSSRLENFLDHISKGDFERPNVKNGSSANEVENENYFLKESLTWKLSYDGSVLQLQEVKGFYDLQKLVSQPFQLFHCTELMGTTLAEKGEKIFDAKAKRQYEKRILEMQAGIQEAEHESDFIRLEKLQDEYDHLLKHLSQSVGLRGKIRERNNSVEKARSAITWRIRSAIARIETNHASLGIHLSNAIKTGIFCSYQPDRKFSWITI